MLDSIKVGDRIVTIGGLYGIIREIKGDVLTLEISKDVKINASRNAIGSKRES